ncbi:hypothetical protein D3C73_1386520 [compost metagenome]
MQHRTAPRHRLVARNEHADGDDLHAVSHRRKDHVVHLGGLLRDAHQRGDGEAVHIGVHNAHAEALGGQCTGQVDGDG